MPDTSELPIHFAGAVLERSRHICAFFESAEAEYRLTLPFVKEGLDRGEKAFHIVDPAQRAAYLARLAEAGIDVEATAARGQFELRPWEEAYLREGHFDQNAMLALIQEVLDGPHIFERFRQADSGTTRLHGGLGLGLALVRHLVELHGGVVSAHSAGEHRGATFTVRVPIGATGVGASSVPAGARGSDAAPAALPSLRGVRVLVVDDHADSRELVAAMLAIVHAETRGCGSALEGFAELVAWRPDVLVSDLEMPGEDGYALMRRVRGLDPDRGGRTPAVALTAYDRVADRERTRAAGFDAHVPKPVEPLDLMATIVRLTRATS